MLDDLHTLLLTVLAGEGMSFLSSDLIAEHVAAGRLVAHRVPGFHHARQRALVLSESVQAGTPLAHLVAIVLRRFNVPLGEFEDQVPSPPRAVPSQAAVSVLSCATGDCGTASTPPDHRRPRAAGSTRPARGSQGQRPAARRTRGG